MILPIRAATGRDAHALAQLLQDRAAAEERTGSTSAEVLAAHLFGPQPKAHVLVVLSDPPAENDAHAPLAGCAFWTYGFDARAGHPLIRIEDLHLRPAVRGRGVALAMFQVLARRAVGEDCGALRWSARVAGAPGMQFYQSLAQIPVAALTSHCLAGDMLTAFAA